MVIYSDESDYEATWRKVDAMFDIRVASPSVPLWERENLWSNCSTIRRNYRANTIECNNSKNECCEVLALEKNTCRSDDDVTPPEFRVSSECQRDYEDLVASIVQDIEDNKIQLGPLSTEFVVAPTKIVYPQVCSQEQHVILLSPLFFHFSTKFPSFCSLWPFENITVLLASNLHGNTFSPSNSPFTSRQYRSKH